MSNNANANVLMAKMGITNNMADQIESLWVKHRDMWFQVNTVNHVFTNTATVTVPSLFLYYQPPIQMESVIPFGLPASKKFMAMDPDGFGHVVKKPKNLKEGQPYKYFSTLKPYTKRMAVRVRIANLRFSIMPKQVTATTQKQADQQSENFKSTIQIEEQQEQQEQQRKEQFEQGFNKQVEEHENKVRQQNIIKENIQTLMDLGMSEFEAVREASVPGYILQNQQQQLAERELEEQQIFERKFNKRVEEHENRVQQQNIIKENIQTLMDLGMSEFEAVREASVPGYILPSLKRNRPYIQPRRPESKRDAYVAVAELQRASQLTRKIAELMELGISREEAAYIIENQAPYGGNKKSRKKRTSKASKASKAKHKKKHRTKRKAKRKAKRRTKHKAKHKAKRGTKRSTRKI